MAETETYAGSSCLKDSRDLFILSEQSGAFLQISTESGAHGAYRGSSTAVCAVWKTTNHDVFLILYGATPRCYATPCVQHGYN